MPLTVQSIGGNATPVAYEPPQVIAGEPPLQTTCTPVSGSTFPLGVTTVACSTRDAVARTDTCTFTVTVNPAPRLAATTFMAFGNSITEGKTASGATPNNYPVQLARMLTSRYAMQAQSISVVNKGLGGESAVQGAQRIHQALDDEEPQVLLLEEGVNDLQTGATAIPSMINALRDMVREAKSRGIVVFLATLTPVREGGTPPRGDAAFPHVRDANTQIRILAASEQVILVDLYQSFGGSPDPYIDVDGLHPTEAGYLKIAEFFFDAIRARLEIAAAPASPGLVRNMPVPTLPFARLR